MEKRKYGGLTFVPFEKSLLSLPYKEYSLFLKPINDEEDESESEDNNDNDKNEAALLKAGTTKSHLCRISIPIKKNPEML